MANISQEVKETLSTPGMKHIVAALRGFHKSQWRKLRDCDPGQVREIQAVMKAIDTALPLILERLINQHLDAKKDRDPSLWWKFQDWVKKFQNRNR